MYTQKLLEQFFALRCTFMYRIHVLAPKVHVLYILVHVPRMNAITQFLGFPIKSSTCTVTRYEWYPLCVSLALFAQETVRGLEEQKSSLISRPMTFVERNATNDERGPGVTIGH